ncbi:MAG TPA: BON domain-containing protein [Dehalococcoidia bacterium]|nr:BON domain-containing protein [Dehalococcoidia bacterium]
MADKTPALRLGAPARFQDRWAGRVASIEISEDWEVYNVAIRQGIFRARTVRLPLEAATEWGDECVAFGQATSNAAFGREVPPVAAPSRPVSEETPIAGGGTLAGLLVSRATRRAGEVLIERGGRVYRVPVEGISFQGKTMYAGVPSDPMVPYFGEDELRERAKAALASVTEISSGELQSMEIDPAGAGVRLTGNVRTRQSREAALRAVWAALGIPVSVRGLITDIEVETELGLAFDRSGLTRDAEIFPRSILGQVVLRGRARTAGAAQEVARATAKVAGVRSVVNRMEVGAPGSGRPAGAAAG